jgi:hypothetical protein
VRSSSDCSCAARLQVRVLDRVAIKLLRVVFVLARRRTSSKAKHSRDFGSSELLDFCWEEIARKVHNHPSVLLAIESRPYLQIFVIRLSASLVRCMRKLGILFTVQNLEVRQGKVFASIDKVVHLAIRAQTARRDWMPIRISRGTGL